MNHRHKPPQHRTKAHAYRQVFERLDAVLEKNTTLDNYEKIRRMRLALFADVDKLQASGRIKIPK